MCGILVTVGSREPLHHRLAEGLRRRGPDAVGFWTDGAVSMVQTRLQILGQDDRSLAPLSSGSHVLAYNGEIYNFLDLARALGMRAASDTPVLLEALKRKGPAVLTELHGFWAFALYDRDARKLTLCRDQIGVKPLYYFHDGPLFVAASTLTTLLTALPNRPSLDHGALSQYVRYQLTFGDRTFLQGVKRVMPGSLVTFDLSTQEASTVQYEDVWSASVDPEMRTSEAWLEETRAILSACVLDSTASDTLVTTTCSGGLDSSAVTRIAAPEVAYHGNYSDPDCNETRYAQMAVEGTRTRLLVCNSEEEFDLPEKLTRIVEDFDDLSVGSVILPLEDLLSQVKKRYRVILTGTGGDELFGGYARYAIALGSCPQESYRALFARLGATPSRFERFEACHVKGDAALYRFYDDVSAREGFRETYESLSCPDDAARMLAFDRRAFLGGLCNIDDKMCGRHSIEARPSLLHQKLVRRLAAVPASVILDPYKPLKHLARSILDGVVPAPILERTDKMGYTTPIGSFVNRSAGRIREIITQSRHRDLYDLRRLQFTAEGKFSREIFGLLLLDLWLDRYDSGAAP
jgi:asparagine synthase (glutamine-hydrolysing)